MTKMGDAILGVAEVGEVAAEHGECSDLRLARTDGPGERERLLPNRQRLHVTPATINAPASDPSA